MSLKVEVVDFGICRTATSYSVFLIHVYQERFEAWTVYRRIESFALLREHLLPFNPSIGELPYLDPNDLDLSRLESCRSVLDLWLRDATSEDYILRMQFMYNFLCLEANLPPPFLENQVRNYISESSDEMEMDDMFGDRNSEEGGDDGDFNDESDDDTEDFDNEDNQECEENKQSAPTTVFAMDELNRRCYDETTQNEHDHHAMKKGKRDGMPPTGKHIRGGRKHFESATDRRDGMDIKSLSFVEAEFIYDEAEGAIPEAEAGEKKRTIKLDAFNIITVIGKGDERNYFYFIFLFSN